MDSDVTGSTNPGPDDGEQPVVEEGSENPGAGGTPPGRGSENPGPSDDPPGRGTGNPGVTPRG